jgi:hypothetical protein
MGLALDAPTPGLLHGERQWCPSGSVEISDFARDIEEVSLGFEHVELPWPVSNASKAALGVRQRRSPLTWLRRPRNVWLPAAAKVF